MFGVLVFATTAFATVTSAGALLAAGPGLRVSITASLDTPIASSARLTVSLSSTLRTSARLEALLVGLRVITTASLAGESVIGGARVKIFINGSEVTQRTKVGSVVIHDENNDAPNTAQLTIYDPVSVGQSVVIRLGDFEPRYLFNGWIETTDESWIGEPRRAVWHVNAVDDQVRTQALLPFGDYNGSASVVVHDLIAQFAPAFTTIHVEANLPPVDVHFDGSEGMSAALSQICKLIGAYYYWEEGDLHLFRTATDPEQPDPIDATHPPLRDAPITKHVDHSQVRTRVYGRGHGEALLTDVAATETILPLENTAMFNSVGGRAIVGTHRLTYAGVQLGGEGGLVGPGMGPTSRLDVTPVAGSGVDPGSHNYAVVYVTADGKSLPSPIATAVTRGVTTAPNPTARFEVAVFQYGNGNYSGTAVALPGGGFDYNAAAGAIGPRIGDHVSYAYSWSTAATQFDLTKDTALSPVDSGEGYWPSSGVVGEAHNYVPAGWLVPQLIQGIAQFPPGTFDADTGVHSSGVTFLHIWRRLNGGPWTFLQSTTLYQYWTSITYNGVGTQDTATPIGGSPPTPNATLPALGKVQIASIPIGPAAVTAREIYRTAAGDLQLRRQQTITNNTATTAVDTLSDAFLGPVAPTVDTSGLDQPKGQVLPGSTSIPANTGPFAVTGGWATVGQQLIRYTGKSGGALTGIPADGPGAIRTTISYNVVINTAPSLIGVSGLDVALLKGTPVNIWIQRDAPQAQQGLAALEGSGSTGIYEYLVVDERRGELSLTGLCEAHLVRYNAPLITVTYDTHDVKTKSGRQITINLDTPTIHETLIIQSVEITNINTIPGLTPRYRVTASSVRFTLEDLLRRLTSSLEGL